MKRKKNEPLFPAAVPDLVAAPIEVKSYGALPRSTWVRRAPEWVPIFIVQKEWATYMWLCDEHVTARRHRGWNCRETEHRPGNLVPFGCDDCKNARARDADAA
jgi:hypothetical protein